MVISFTENSSKKDSKLDSYEFENWYERKLQNRLFKSVIGRYWNVRIKLQPLSRWKEVPVV